MHKYIVSPTSQYKSDFKKLSKNDKILVKFVIDMLSNGVTLDPKYKDHALKGKLSGKHDCHVRPGLILIYSKDNDKLVLYVIRVGSHSKLKLTTSLEEDIEVHDSLNPKLFNKDKLIPEVRDTILNITDEFLNQLDDSDVIIVPKDIVILGSNCSYNYNSGSDLDVHIIADDSIDCDKKHLDKMYNAYKTIFNKNIDATIKRIPVEIFVEMGKCNAKSNGIYSVEKDEWIKFPEKTLIPDIDMEAVDNEYEHWENKYFEIAENPTSKSIESLINDIYELRQSSISTEGEYGIGNLVFKEFRGNGLLDNLKELWNECKSDELSLESFKNYNINNKIIH